MDKITHPIETIIDFAWAAGADRFWVNNAKDALKRLMSKAEKDTGFHGPIAWANITGDGDFYNFSIIHNQYITNFIPVYVKIKDVEQAMSSISPNQQ